MRTTALTAIRKHIQMCKPGLHVSPAENELPTPCVISNLWNMMLYKNESYSYPIWISVRINEQIIITR